MADGVVLSNFDKTRSPVLSEQRTKIFRPAPPADGATEDGATVIKRNREELRLGIGRGNPAYRSQILYNQNKFVADGLKRIIKATADGARNLLWLGGVRSLKTSSMMQLLGYHATGVYPGQSTGDTYIYNGYRYTRPVKIIAVSLNNTMSRDIVQAYLTKTDIASGRTADIINYTDYILKSGVKGAYEKIFVPHFTNGVYDGDSEVIFKSAEEGATAFQGFNGIDLVFIDEEPKYDVFKECLSRLAGVNDRKTFLFLAQWPVSGKSDIVKYFTEGKDKDVVSDYTFYTQSGWEENPFLSKEEIEKMEQDYPAWELPARKYGTPMFGHGKVFEFFISDILADDFDLSALPQSWKLIGGVDPSATSNGTWGACLLALSEDGCVYLCKEYLSTNKRLDEHGQNIRAMFSFIPYAPIVCDPAGGGENYERQSALEYLRDEQKLNILVADKANQAKNNAINKIYLLKRDHHFKICKGCIKSIEEFDSYSRDENNKIIKQNDHIIDACFYALNKINYAVTKAQLYGSQNGILYNI